MTQTVSCTCTGQPRFCGRLSSKTEADDMYVLVHNVCVLGCKEPDDMDRVSWPRMNVQNSSSLSLPYLYLHPFLNFSGMMHPFTSHDLAHTPHSASDILPSPRTSLSAVRQSYASVELFFFPPSPRFFFFGSTFFYHDFNHRCSLPCGRYICPDRQWHVLCPRSHSIRLGLLCSRPPSHGGPFGG